LKSRNNILSIKKTDKMKEAIEINCREINVGRIKESIAPVRG
jgi:hypothetical protein